MKRPALMELARRHGYPDRPRPEALRAELRAYFRTQEGKRALSIAPGVASDSGMRPMTEDDAIAALLDEVAEVT